MENKTRPWNNQKSAYQAALHYIAQRKQGLINSFRTPWAKMNDAGVDGFEWHSLVVIGARPRTGKTLIKDQIIREIATHNQGQTINVLEFQLEMLARSSKVREFCAILGKPYKYVCSASENDKLTDEDLNKLYEYSKKAVGTNKTPVDIIEKPCTVTGFIKIVTDYMEDHAVIIEGKKVYINTVVTLDHCLLLNKEKDDKTKTDMLYNLGEAVTALKRKYPIVFIILSQLGRDMEKPERNENGKYGNYVLDSDMFGGDALFQHADIVIGINRPALKAIEYYGPERYLIADDSVLIFHFLKCRNGDTRMSFFKAEFDKMQIIEMETPKMQKKLITTFDD